MTYANSADPDQIAPDQGLHCLPFHQVFFRKQMHNKQNLAQNTME